MSMVELAEAKATLFAKLILKKKWPGAAALFAASTPEGVAEQFEWKKLKKRLHEEWIQATGIDPDIASDLDPPKRFEVFAMEDEPAPAGFEAVPYCWIEVDFLPSEDSEFDHCYNAFLAFTGDDPKIVAVRVDNNWD